jgi:hypothetical protein
MTTTGNSFKFYLNGKESTEQEVRDCKENMSVTVDGFNCFYSFLSKIEKHDFVNVITNNISEEILKPLKAVFEKQVKERQEFLDKLAKEMYLKYETPLLKAVRLEKENLVTEVDKLTMQSFYEVVYTKPTSNWNKIEITFSDKDLPKLDRVSVHSIMEDFKILAKKDKTEEKPKGYLSTRHKKPNSMYIDEVLADIAEKEIKAKSDDYCEYINSTIGRPSDTNFRNYAEYPMTPEESFKGVKETDGKLDYELDWNFIQQMAERMSQNKGKYKPFNWMLKMDVEKLKQSLFRHVIEIMKGNYSDDNREYGHLESVADNVMMINYQLKNQ